MSKKNPDNQSDETSDPGTSGGVIRFVSSGETPPKEGEPVVDWRDELKQKIEAHAKRKEGTLADEPEADLDPRPDLHADPEPPVTSPQTTQDQHTLVAEGEESAELEETLEFEEVDLEVAELTDGEDSEVTTTIDIVEGSTYERAVYPEEDDEPAKPRQQIITFSEKASPGVPPLEKSVFDMRPHSESDDPSSEGDEVPGEAQSADRGVESSYPSREIFVSRVLAGLVDLLLAVALAIAGAAIASRMLNFSIVSRDSGILVVGLGLFFFVFSSIFLLLTSGQTIGMRLTRLRLVHVSTSLPASAVIVRVLAFLPVTATFVGLLWGLFDPWGRCLHDRVSQTRVVPLEQVKLTPAGLGLLR